MKDRDFVWNFALFWVWCSGFDCSWVREEHEEQVLVILPPNLKNNENNNNNNNKLDLKSFFKFSLN